MTDDDYRDPDGVDQPSSERFEVDCPDCGRTHYIACRHIVDDRTQSAGSEEPPHEPVGRDDKIQCPVTNCPWWIPGGMGYLYVRHRLAHIDGWSPFEDHETLPTDLSVAAATHRDERDEYRGPADIETFGTLTDESSPDQVTVDIWSADRAAASATEDVEGAGHADVSLRLTHEAARELGKRLLADADRAQQIAETSDAPDTE
jgi:hypothetical protein